MKVRVKTCESLLGTLDHKVKTSILEEYTFSRKLSDGTHLNVSGTAAGVQPVCNFVADVLEMINGGANLAEFDACGMGVDLLMTEFDARDEMARHREMNLVFMEIPVSVKFVMK